MTPTETILTDDVPSIPAEGAPSAARAWLRALARTAPITKNPTRLLSTVIEDMAGKCGETPALLSDSECMTYRELARRANQYTRWALRQGLGRGDAVCLLMPNRPEYLAIWLGISRAGCVVALLNTNLAGASLAHCIDIASASGIIVAAEFVEKVTTALDPAKMARIWVHGADIDEFDRIDAEIERYSGERLGYAERRRITIEECALYIFTSGTTGLPKAANVSHGRLMQWSHWFAGMMDTRSSDRLYNCLPMYHSVGGVLATGAVLTSGGSVVIREKFSASQFWSDIVRFDCTLFQYIGELCRYLLHTPPVPMETEHRIRMCCGNGLKADIWNAFKIRYRIPKILEFYAATESNVSMFNVEGKPGAVGRIPAYLAHRFPATLVQFDAETGEPVRNEKGFCVRCGPDEAGEAIGRILKNPANAANRFEGYTNNEKESRRKILRDVFEAGDSWFRTGDLMRRDKRGYFYFVDRIGDSLRWKGENISTSEVVAAIYSFSGIRQATVHGVSVPGTDGRAGLATIAAEEEVDLARLRTHLSMNLPEFAHPVFLRIRETLEVTATFKYTRNNLTLEECDPAATSDVIYFNHRKHGAFVQLDKRLYEDIRSGRLRL
jgi:fatty-acyl-CoA synthase